MFTDSGIDETTWFAFPVIWHLIVTRLSNEASECQKILKELIFQIQLSNFCYIEKMLNIEFMKNDTKGLLDIEFN